MTCRNCEIAGFLEEEARMTWRSDDEARDIRALAGSWQRKCTCKPREQYCFRCGKFVLVVNAICADCISCWKEMRVGDVAP